MCAPNWEGRTRKKKSRALLAGAVALCSSMAFANDIDVSTDNTVDFGEKTSLLITISM